MPDLHVWICPTKLLLSPSVVCNGFVGTAVAAKVNVFSVVIERISVRLGTPPALNEALISAEWLQRMDSQ
jgi:hypothetical protein